MDSHSYTSSGASSPRHQDSCDISESHTPATERSLLFDGSFDEDFNPSTEFILVVGGLGYIGSHTCLELLKAGHNIVILDNLSNSFRETFDRIHRLAEQHYETRPQSLPLMRFCEADYRDQRAVRLILQQYEKKSAPSLGLDGAVAVPATQSHIKGVIHFGGYKSVSESIKSPLKYYANNVAGMVEFCLTLDEFNIKTFIFSSSATVYGTMANSGLPLKEEYCTHKEESFVDHDGTSRTTQGGCTGLTNAYGRSKWMCEAILSDLAVADPEWTIVALRYFNPVGCDESGLLGEDPRGVPTNLMPVVVRVLTGQMPVLSVFGTDYPTPDGTAIRDFIHVTDLARGHLAAVNAASDGRVPKGFRTYNLGSGTGQSVYDVVKGIEAVSASKIPIQNLGRREGDVGICVAMPQRAEVELDWKTEKTLDTCCKDIWNFLEQGKEGKGEVISQVV